MSLAGWPFGKFNLSKQNSSVSSSGPSITSYPIDINKSSISSIVLFSGCSLPLMAFLLGRVMSIVSFSSFLLSSTCLNSFSFSDIRASNSSLTSFTKLPITGLSSAESAPIPLSTEVSSPFFPKYFTFKSTKDCKLSTFNISSLADILICSICSFINPSFLGSGWFFERKFFPLFPKFPSKKLFSPYRTNSSWYHLILYI